MATDHLPQELADIVRDHLYCRDNQIKRLQLLLGSGKWAPQTLVLHGTEATGKSTAVQCFLSYLRRPSAIVRCLDFVSTRQFLENTVSSVREALGANTNSVSSPKTVGRCDSIAAFVGELRKLLLGRESFVLVFDNVDKQREPAQTLLPALARLGEVILNLSTVLITARASPHVLRNSTVLFLHFPPYTREETITILSHSSYPKGSLGRNARTSTAEAPERTFSDEDTEWLWTRYCGHLWDSLGQGAARDLLSFRCLCERLWQPFTQPVIDGHYGTRGSRELSKLLVRNRGLLHSETALTSPLIPVDPAPAPTHPKNGLENWRLPPIPSFLLLASYLASTTQPKHDIVLFSRTWERKRRKKHARRTHHSKPVRATARKLPRRLLGRQAFVLERMLAIFHSLTDGEVKGGGAEILGQFATLSSMRLVVKAGLGVQDVIAEGGGKWKCVIGDETAMSLARGVGIDLENYMIE